MAGKINDFGEKIGGARKDLVTARRDGFTIDLISKWTDVERQTFVVKNELWPTPNYQKMLDDGYERDVIFYIKRLRDSLPVRPDLSGLAYYDENSPRFEERKNEIYENYIHLINTYKNAVSEFRTIGDAVSYSEQIAKGYIEIPKVNDYKVMRKINRARNLTSTWELSVLIREMNNKQFLFTEKEKILSNYKIYGCSEGNPKVEVDSSGKQMLSFRTASSRLSFFNLQDSELFEQSSWKPGTFFILAENAHSIVGRNFETKEAAEEYLLENHKISDVNKKQRKESFVPPQLEHIVRIGQDYRKGRRITGEKILNAFGFRGGEFGNWLNQVDRQANLNMSYEGFFDLAKALGITNKDISLGGKLAIAFGARGRGGKNAGVAHFEVVSNVINLTKMKGAGSTAHEWFHALDAYLANVNKRTQYFETAVPGYKSVLDKVMRTIKYSDPEHPRSSAYTDFYKAACNMDKKYSKTDNGYWHSDVELFARAGAAYAYDKIAPNRSDYMCGHANLNAPRGTERERINKAFDSLFESLIEKGIFNKREPEIAQVYENIHQEDGKTIFEKTMNSSTSTYEWTRAPNIDGEQMTFDDLFAQDEFKDEDPLELFPNGTVPLSDVSSDIEVIDSDPEK